MYELRHTSLVIQKNCHVAVQRPFSGGARSLPGPFSQAGERAAGFFLRLARGRTGFFSGWREGGRGCRTPPERPLGGVFHAALISQSLLPANRVNSPRPTFFAARCLGAPRRATTAWP